jgi:hypothetical protein
MLLKRCKSVGLKSSDLGGFAMGKYFLSQH